MALNRTTVSIEIMMTDITALMAAIQPPNPTCFNVPSPKGDNCMAHYELLANMYKECGELKSQPGQAACYCRWGVGDEIIGAVEPCVRDHCRTDEEIDAALNFANETQSTYEEQCKIWLPIAVREEPALLDDVKKISEKIKKNGAGEVDLSDIEPTKPSSAVAVGVKLKDVAIAGMLVASFFALGGL